MESLLFLRPAHALHIVLPALRAAGLSELVVNLTLWPAAQDGPFTVSLWLKANTLNQSGVLFQYLFSASQNATYEAPAVNLDPWAPNQVCWTGNLGCHHVMVLAPMLGQSQPELLSIHNVVPATSQIAVMV